MEQVEHRRPVALAVERAVAAEEGREAFGRLSLRKAARGDRIAPAGHRRIGRGQLEQADPGGAERETRLVGQRSGDAEVARGADDIRHPDVARQPDRRGVARPGEGFAQGDPAAMATVAVDRSPAVNGDRRIVNQAVGRPAGAQGGEIDEQLERRSRLAPRLGRAVERRVDVALAADHRDHPPVGAHRDQRRLRSRRRPPDRALGDLLEPAVERRGNLHLAEIGVERLRRERRDPIGEIGSGRDLRRLRYRAGETDRARALGADLAGIRHRPQHQPAALARTGQVVRRSEPRGRLDHARKHRRLGQAEVVGIALEIMVRRGAQAIDSVAEIDARQIAREDVLLGQPRLQPEGDDHFLRLALDRPVARQERGLGELLGDRASALANAAAAQVGDQRPPDPARIDPPVAIEAAILDRHERRRSQRVELRRVDRRLLDRAAPGDRVAVVGQEQHRRIRQRLERARQRRGDHQPREGDEDQRGDGIEHERPAAALGRSDRRDGPLLSNCRCRRSIMGRERVRKLLDRHSAAAPNLIVFRHSLDLGTRSTELVQ